MSGPTDFYAVVAGRHYDYTSTTYELDNALTSTTINKGENVVGVIVSTFRRLTARCCTRRTTRASPSASGCSDRPRERLGIGIDLPEGRVRRPQSGYAHDPIREDDEKPLEQP